MCAAANLYQEMLHLHTIMWTVCREPGRNASQQKRWRGLTKVTDIDDVIGNIRNLAKVESDFLDFMKTCAFFKPDYLRICKTAENHQKSKLSRQAVISWFFGQGDSLAMPRHRILPEVVWWKQNGGGICRKSPVFWQVLLSPVLCGNHTESASE